MGTVNYGTSDFLTIGLIPYDYEEAREDLESMYFEDEAPELSDDEVYSYIYDIEGDDRMNLELYMNKLSFSVFDVEIKPGYYEGFYIDIRFNQLYLWDEEERETAKKEAEVIRDLWTWAVNNTPCAEVWPGYCTSYKDYDTTINSINTAYEDMIKTINNLPVEEV